MNILFSLLPALFWGFLPLAVSKVGGRPIQQILGTTVGTCLVAVLVFCFRQPNIEESVFAWCMLSGAFWAVAQMLQYRSFEQIGVSNGIPISVGMQLTANALVGTFALGDWPTAGAKLVGFSAIVLIILGIYLTTLQEKLQTQLDLLEEEGRAAAQFSDGAARQSRQPMQSSRDMKGGLVTLAVATVGYVGFTFIPAKFHVPGEVAFLPQAVGMVLSSVVLSLFFLKQQPYARKSVQNLLGGFIFAVAVLLYLISIELNGVSIAASMAQMNVVLATLGGIYILKERKTKWELRRVYLGLFLVVIGGILIGLTSTDWVADLL